MNEMDLYYRALRHYRKAVTADKTHMRFLQAIAKAPAREDKLEAIRTKCIIDEEWVATIEKYLPFVEKAIREDRQFIRQEGETVPIEKAKKVSKASVAHLARHSDMITHLPEHEGDPLLPDKIYITENESNYAVYENRFLYMLLCYTRDFVELRYTKISELGNTYRGNLRIKKHVELGKRTVTFDATLGEVAKNDPRFAGDRAMHDMIERLEAIRVQVSALLLTPLMNEVSKAPMLRPPITRTNVLRMDNNFKNAVALYDYLAAYEGVGYTIEEIKKSFSPFPEKMGAELFESIPLLTHLLYKYGNDIEDELKTAYDRAEAEAAVAEAARKAKELEALRHRIHESERTMEDYLLLMESYAGELEKNMERMRTNEQKLHAKLDRLGDELNWQKDLERQLKKSVSELQDTNNDLQNTLESERSQHLATIAEKDAAHERDKAQLCEEHAQSMTEAARLHRAEIAALQQGRATVEQELNARIEELDLSLREMEQARVALCARLHAYQSKQGENADTDLTDKANFAMLEEEREWFEKMFRETWKSTKKRIRHELLWKKRKTTDKHETTAPSDGEVTEPESLPNTQATGEVEATPPAADQAPGKAAETAAPQADN
ncbi:MAG: hypothetical protein IJW22_09200 [Clostridia bacterium]|nr:hypothetical protein [Clostridia bacterium]